MRVGKRERPVLGKAAESTKEIREEGKSRARSETGETEERLSRACKNAKVYGGPE